MSYERGLCSILQAGVKVALGVGHCRGRWAKVLVYRLGHGRYLCLRFGTPILQPEALRRACYLYKAVQYGVYPSPYATCRLRSTQIVSPLAGTC